MNDKNYIWHPYTQEKNAIENILIHKGKGVYLYGKKKEKYIDAISSWWTNIHGHSHPYIAKAIAAQAKKLDHVIFAGYTHPPAISLSKLLLEKIPGKYNKVFFSDNGSTAVEVALKMSLQYWHNLGIKKDKIIALKNCYHGDTFGSMSVSSKSVFTRPFESLLFETYYVDIDKKNHLKELHSFLLKNKNKVACFIYEPLVQGAGGMKIVDKTSLNKIIAVCRKEKITTIADEVMTGFGRTGTMLASEQLNYFADIACLSKGITGGTAPLGVTLCKNDIYNAFYNSDKLKTFFHGHSYTANPIICAAALASLQLFEKEKTLKKVKRIAAMNLKFCVKLMQYNNISDIRCIGSILAFNLKSKNNIYTNDFRDKIILFFQNKGIIIRPIGNTFYIMPPYCINPDQLQIVYSAIQKFLAQNDI